MLNEKCQWGEGEITKLQLKTFERVLDSLFSKLNIDVAFTKHFFDRLNDKRNRKQITLCELSQIFSDVYKKFGLHLRQIGDSHREVEEIIKSTSSHINIPFILKWDKHKNEIILVTKTIMRKRNFKASNKVLRVESFKEFLMNEFWTRDKKKLHEILRNIRQVEKKISEKRKLEILKRIKKLYDDHIQDDEVIDYDVHNEYDAIIYKPAKYKIQSVLNKIPKNKEEQKLVFALYKYFTSNEVVGFQDSNKTEKLLKKEMRIK
jgi:hypothetical protein